MRLTCFWGYSFTSNIHFYLLPVNFVSVASELIGDSFKYMIQEFYYKILFIVCPDITHVFIPKGKILKLCLYTLALLSSSKEYIYLSF